MLAICTEKVDDEPCCSCNYYSKTDSQPRPAKAHTLDHCTSTCWWGHARSNSACIKHNCSCLAVFILSFIVPRLLVKNQSSALKDYKKLEVVYPFHLSFHFYILFQWNSNAWWNPVKYSGLRNSFTFLLAFTKTRWFVSINTYSNIAYTVHPPQTATLDRYLELFCSLQCSIRTLVCAIIPGYEP